MFSVYISFELTIVVLIDGYYENLLMQYSAVKIENLIDCFFFFFFFFFFFNGFAIDCGYSLEQLQQGGSNEYPQSMFWSKNKKNRYNPAYPSFSI